MSNLFKRFFTHKSKFLLIILCLLGLAFSYSCSCRNDSTGPGNDGNGGNGGGSGNNNNTPTWSFSPAENQDNIHDISFGSKGDKKRDAVVTFYEPDNHQIKRIDIEDVQDPKNVLNKANVQYRDGKLIISTDNLKKLADGLTSTDKPATNQVPIVFKLTSTNDTAGEDNIKYITNTFNFIKALKIDNDNIESILQGSGVDVGWIKDFDADNYVIFKTSSGKYSSGVFTLNPDDTTKSNSDNIPKDEARTKLINGLNNEKKNTAQYFTVKEDGKDVTLTKTTKDNDTVTFSLLITYTDIAEGDLNSITFKFISENDEAKWN